MKIILVGFGIIGKGVLKAINLKSEHLKKKYGLDLKVAAICDRSGAAIDEEGLDLELALKVKEETRKISNYPEKGCKMDILEVIESVNADVVVEVSPTNIETGEPAKSYMLKAFETKKHVVSANKGPLAVSFKELVTAAEKNKLCFRYEASVGGAMPIINLAKETLLN